MTEQTVDNFVSAAEPTPIAEQSAPAFIPQADWDKVKGYVEDRLSAPQSGMATRALPQRPMLGPGDLPLPPAPLPSQWKDPVFWTTSVVPIILAVVAFLFHKDLSASAPQIASLGAAAATFGYAIYAAIVKHAHATAVAAFYGAQSASFQYRLSGY